MSRRSSLNNGNKAGNLKRENLTFARRLRELMGKWGITQEELANHINVNRSTISRWLHGLASPDLFRLAEIADFFRVDPSYFVSEFYRENVSDTVEGLIQEGYGDDFFFSLLKYATVDERGKKIIQISIDRVWSSIKYNRYWLYELSPIFKDESEVKEYLDKCSDDEAQAIQKEIFETLSASGINIDPTPYFKDHLLNISPYRDTIILPDGRKEDRYYIPLEKSDVDQLQSIFSGDYNPLTARWIDQDKLKKYMEDYNFHDEPDK